MRPVGNRQAERLKLSDHVRESHVNFAQAYIVGGTTSQRHDEQQWGFGSVSLEPALRGDTRERCPQFPSGQARSWDRSRLRPARLQLDQGLARTFRIIDHVPLAIVVHV